MENVLDFSTCIEQVGACSDGKITEDQLEEEAKKSCPGCGSCSGRFYSK